MASAWICLSLILGSAVLAAPRQGPACPAGLLRSERDRLLNQEPEDTVVIAEAEAVRPDGTYVYVRPRAGAPLEQVRTPGRPRVRQRVAEEMRAAQGARQARQDTARAAAARAAAQEVTQLRTMVEVSKGMNEGRLLDPRERSLLVRDLRRMADRIGTRTFLGPAEAELVREARIRAAILEAADTPPKVVEWSEFDVHGRPLGQTIPAIRRFEVGRPALEHGTLEVDPRFASSYDHAAPLQPGLPQTTGWAALADAEAGAPFDVQWTGESTSVVNRVDRRRYEMLDANKPFSPPPPLPYRQIRIGRGAPAARLAQILEPGEHATLIGQGGANSVYLTHPPTPEEIIAQGEQAIRVWVSDNRYRVIKVAGEHEQLARIARTDHAMLSVSRQMAERARFDGRPLMYVVEKTDTRYADLGITIEPYIRGKTPAEIQVYLDHYYGPNCNAACRQGMADLFEMQGLLSPPEMRQRIAALEQAYRDVYGQALRFARANNLIERANWARQTPEGLNYRVEQAVDYNHGSNHFWDSERRMWAQFDR